MKCLLILSAFVSLAGCASLTDTSINQGGEISAERKINRPSDSANTVVTGLAFLTALLAVAGLNASQK